MRGSPSLRRFAWQSKTCRHGARHRRRGNQHGGRDSAAGVGARHLGVDAVRLGGAAVLHGRHHLHLRTLFRFAHGERSGSRRRPHGAMASATISASSSPFCLRSSARSPTRPGRASRGSRFFAAIKITSLCLLWFASPGSNLFLVVFFFSLASVAAEFSTVFNDSMMPRLVPQERDRPHLQHGLGTRLSRRHDRADLRRRCSGRLAGDRQDASSASTRSSGSIRKLGEDARATGPLSAVWYFLFILPMFFFTPDAIKGIPIGPAVREGLSRTEVDAGRSDASAAASSASSLPA